MQLSELVLPLANEIAGIASVGAWDLMNADSDVHLPTWRQPMNEVVDLIRGQILDNIAQVLGRPVLLVCDEQGNDQRGIYLRVRPKGWGRQSQH